MYQIIHPDCMRQHGTNVPNLAESSPFTSITSHESKVYFIVAQISSATTQ